MPAGPSRKLTSRVIFLGLGLRGGMSSNSFLTIIIIEPFFEPL